jgi:hypothetical protein
MCALLLGAVCVHSVNVVVFVGKKREKDCGWSHSNGIDMLICDIIALLKATFFGVVIILIVR